MAFGDLDRYVQKNEPQSPTYTIHRKKLRKTQTNGSMYHAHGLEELTSSKWPYYPKQFIDSM